MRRENLKSRLSLCFLVMLERSGHRTTSPAVYWQKPVRAASVDDAPWSQPSLRSRSGMRLSQARPLLSRLCPAPLIPARSFGLGLRFDEALLVTRQTVSCQKIQANPRNERRVARNYRRCKSPGSKPLVETTQIGSIAKQREPDQRPNIGNYPTKTSRITGGVGEMGVSRECYSKPAPWVVAKRVRERGLGYLQFQINAYIREALDSDGMVPSYNMIARQLNTTRQDVCRSVKRLEKRGLLSRVGSGRSRRIRLPA